MLRKKIRDLKLFGERYKNRIITKQSIIKHNLVHHIKINWTKEIVKYSLTNFK